MHKDNRDKFDHKDKPDAVHPGHPMPVSREQELRESEIKFRSLFNQATDAILLMSLSDKVPVIIDVNDAALKMHGYVEEELTGKPVSFLDDAESIRKIPERIKEIKEKGRTFFEATHVRKDGTTFPVEVNAQIIKVGDESLILSIDRDITRRKQAERELKESKKRFELAIKGSKDGVWDWTDLNSDTYWWSDRVYEIFGYEPGEIEPKISTWKKLIHPDDKDRVLKVLEEHFNEESPYEVEFRIKRKSGEYIWIFAKGESVRDKDGKPVRMSGSVSDINDRRIAEQTLADQKDFLNSIFESLTHPFYVINIDDYRIAHMNPAARPEKGGDNITCYQLSHGFNRPCATDEHPCVLELVKENRGPVTVEHIHYDKHGRSRNVEIHGYPVFDKRDNVTQVIEYNIDITDRKKAEEERKRLNEELQQIIYTVSHDLRSPLVNISGYSKELNYSLNDLQTILHDPGLPADRMDKVRSVIENDIAESLGYITSSIKRMDSLLSGLLKLSKTGSIEMIITTCDMNRIVSGILNSMEYQLVLAGTTCEVSELPTCKGDENQLNQLFSNLIGNAVKYLGPSRSGIIKINGARDKNNSVYCVEDNGIGIENANLDKIFDIFHQIDRDSEGEGIGLSIVKKIINRLNGDLWIESEPGKGSKFYVSLPS